MKIFLKIILILVVFVLGYVAGNFIPWSGFSFVGDESGIFGSAKLEVSLLLDNNQPVDRVEMDLAEKPGPPKKGGVAVTDENGIAVFNVQPGSYFIYFNSGNFPKNLQEPEPQPIQVIEGENNKKTIKVTTKKDQ
jgi:hypothetical protein